MKPSAVAEHRPGPQDQCQGTAESAWASQTRPRLRRDVVFADTGDGVFLHHGDDGFVIKGKSAYRWVSTLIPYLNGEQTVAELCDGVSTARRTMVVEITRTLLDRGFARPAAAADSITLPPPLTHRFGPQLSYIDHYADDPVRRFLKFRTSRTLIAGSGQLALAAAGSLLRNGMEAVELGNLPESGPVPEALAAQARELHLAGCPAIVRAAEFGHGLRAGDVDGYDVVLAIGDELGPAALLDLSRHCVLGGPVLVPAISVGRHAILGPAVRRGHSPCWVCAMLRLSANLEPAAPADLWRAMGTSTKLRPAVDRMPTVEHMIGNTLAFEVFRLCTGLLPAETDDAMVVQDLDTLESVRDRLLPHPGCPVCAGGPVRALDRPDCLREPAERLTEEEILNRQAVLFGRYAGVFSEYADIGVTQSPVKVGSIRVGPAGRFLSGTRRVSAFDLHSVFAARIRAFAAAALAYVDEVAAGAGTEAAVVAEPDNPGAEAVPPGRLAAWSGLPEPGGPAAWVPARSLVSGSLRQVPAAAAYPHAPVNRELAFERTSAGTGCGLTAADAVRDGLVSAFAGGALRDAASGRGRVVGLTSSELSDHPEIGFLLRAVHNLGREARLLALPGGAPASVILAVSECGLSCADCSPAAWSVGAAPSTLAAVAAALRDLVGGLQLRREQDGTENPPGRGNQLLPDFDPRTLQPAPSADTDAASLQAFLLGRSKPGAAGDAPLAGASTADLLESLRSQGRDALVVDTTTCDLRAAGFVTVRVLMTR